jgi:cytochrome c553
VTTKICTCCKQEKDSDQFNKEERIKDGLSIYCKDCIKEKRKERRRKNKQKLKSIIPTGTKICNKCHEEKDVKEFNKDYSSIDGLNRWCKQCQSIAHQIRSANLIHETVETKVCSKCGIEKNVDEFYKSKNNEDGCHPWCKECDIKYAENYYVDNTNEILEIHKRWQISNPEKYKQCMEVWRKSKEGKLSERKSKKRRREIMSQLPYTFTKKEWQECLDHFDHACAYCGSTENIQRDHFISVFNYGPYTKDNMIVACGFCNPSKCDNDFFKWYPKQEFYSKERENKILKYLGYIK